tara:strand:- start:57 stop:434 length:378 start_codon:yes stop_codon:yes gene_type:complete
MAKNKFQVRFNLGRGDNFMKWKVSSPIGEATYHEPSEVLIIMHGCKLVNHKGTAKKIHDGANKTVCAWVECDDVNIIDKVVGQSDARQVCYNPRVTPHWVLEEEVVDKVEFEELFTVGKSVRVTE